MKRLLTHVLVLTVLCSLTARLHADDRWETLRAINWVENPTNHTKRGKFGELGPYQFRPNTWRMHTRKSFQFATDRAVADEVAVKHYEWIKENLERAGVDSNAFNIAMAWNSGVNNVIKGRVPNVSYNYAQRVVNLVQTFKHQAALRTAATERASAPAVAEVPASVPVASRIPSLEEAMFDLGAIHGGPKFEVVTDPVRTETPEMVVVYTDRAPTAASKPVFIFAPTATATLTPTFNVVPAFSVN